MIHSTIYVTLAEARMIHILVIMLCFLACTHARAVPAPTSGEDAWDHTKDEREASQCHLKRAVLPLCSASGTCLTPPPRKSKLIAVALGVGTQNYTCSSSTATPVANGAKATIYDISCLVTNNPAAAHYLSALIVLADLHEVGSGPSNGSIPMGIGFPQIGQHIFTPNAQTAVFMLEGKEPRRLVGGRLENIATPPTALPGSVDWLRLGRIPGKEDESKGIKFIYRVHTAGGRPPLTCEDATSNGEIAVPYATEYWIYD